MKSQSFNDHQTRTAILPYVALALVSSATFWSSESIAQSPIWQTIDDVPEAYANGIVSDAQGNTFIAGSIRSTTGIHRALLLRSNDQGATWDMDPTTPGDDPSDTLSSTDGTNAYFGGITFGNVVQNGSPVQHLVTSGIANKRWVVRRSTTAGSSWVTLDDFAPSKSYESTGVSKPAVDSSGTVYVPGTVTERAKGKTTTRYLIRKRAANSWVTLNVSFPVSRIVCVGTTVFAIGDTATNSAWQVRRSTDGGSTWTLVDSTVVGNVVADATVDSVGNIYVVGWDHRDVQEDYGLVTQRYWITRKGTNGGTTWSEVDNFAMPRSLVDLGGGRFAGVHSFASGIAVDLNDNVYVTGVGVEDLEGRHWITRKLESGSSTFVTDDDYVISGTSDMNGRHIAGNPSGRVFATGYISGTPLGVQGWVVRRRELAQ